MERCLIADVQNRLIGKLSKGYRQRVGLAQAIVSDPQVLILDEPTIGLDPRQITEIRSLIKSLAGEHTVILSTHILPEVSMVCSGVVIINKGSIVAQGPIDTPGRAVLPDRARRGRDRRLRRRRSARRSAGIAGRAARGRSERPPTAPRATWSRRPGVATCGARSSSWPPQQKWDLRGAPAVGMTLEEVFMRIVAGEETDAAVPATPAPAPAEAEAAREDLADLQEGDASLLHLAGGLRRVFTIFLLIAGYFFYSIFAFFTRASMQTAMNPQMGRDLNVTDSVLRPLFANVSVILLLLMPLVTMRLFAEERRAGTIELLLTYPVRDGAVLLGKYLAALALYVVMLAGTLLYPAILLYFARLEWGPLAHRLPRSAADGRGRSSPSGSSPRR